MGGFPSKAYRGASLDEGGNKREDWTPGYSARMQEPGAEAVPEGYSWRNVLASYVYLHFGSRPDLAPCFVSRCAAVDHHAAGSAAAAAAAGSGRVANFAARMRRAQSAAPAGEYLPPPAMLESVGPPCERTATLPVTCSSPNLVAQLEAAEAAQRHRHSAAGDGGDWNGIVRQGPEQVAQPHSSQEWPEMFLRPGSRTGQPSLDGSMRSASVDGLDMAAAWGDKVPHAPRPCSPTTTLTRAPSSSDADASHTCGSPPLSPTFASPSYGAARAKRPVAGPVLLQPQRSLTPPRHHPPSHLYHSHSSATLHGQPPSSGAYAVANGLETGTATALARDRDRTQYATTTGQDTEVRWGGKAGAVPTSAPAQWRTRNESVVSLSPAATELLFAIGLGARCGCPSGLRLARSHCPSSFGLVSGNNDCISCGESAYCKCHMLMRRALHLCSTCMCYWDQRTQLA